MVFSVDSVRSVVQLFRGASGLGIVNTKKHPEIGSLILPTSG